MRLLRENDLEGCLLRVLGGYEAFLAVYYVDVWGFRHKTAMRMTKNVLVVRFVAVLITGMNFYK